MLLDVLLDLLQRDFRRMLGRDHDCIHPNRLVPFVFDRYLCFAIRTEVRKGFVLPHLRELSGEPMSECNRHRHQFRRLVRRIPKHQPLVTGT
ncbi:hypothetical protein D3C73_1461940 [compost metagenome]